MTQINGSSQNRRHTAAASFEWGKVDLNDEEQVFSEWLVGID